MTKAKTPAALAAGDLDVENLIDTFNAHRREITIGAVVIAVVAGGLLLWRLSVNQKGERADQALAQATGALDAGNKPLAMTELQAVSDRYRGTPAGVEASMIVAQLNFEDAKWADGIKVLEAVQPSGPTAAFRAPVDGLLGGGYADLKKYDDAVKQYQAAADATDAQTIKDVYLADEARILMLAGKKDDARKLWEAMASRPDSPVVAEAKVRLGELDAVAEGKN